jgi:ABC-type nickel/cobalt efflux system permease component RcnA
MIATLFLGFLVGMQHAMEADHVAAVSSIVARETGTGRIIRHGIVWGLGHAATLMLFAGAVVLVDGTIGGELAAVLEFAVGAMLVLLGGHVLWRLVRDRVHFHVHRHTQGTVHVHAHSHQGERRRHDPDAHEHEHPKAFPVRTLLVGLMHGMAGSAALLILTASVMPSATLGLVYVAVFGIGSVLGMALLSAVISVPLAFSARFLTGGQRVLQGVIGLGTVALGVFTMVATAAALP